MKEYVKPSETLLKKSAEGQKDLTDQRQTAEKLVEIFANLNIHARLRSVSVGPAVSGYQFWLPNPAIAARIKAHTDIIAYNLQTQSIRIHDYWRTGKRDIILRGAPSDEPLMYVDENTGVQAVSPALTANTRSITGCESDKFIVIPGYIAPARVIYVAAGCGK